MRNQYKIDCHHEYDRVERPFGVYVKSPRIFARWKYVCCFKLDSEAQAYITGLLDLPRLIFRAHS